MAAARLADRYISDRFLPDKAIDLMDEAASKVRLRNSMLPPEAKDLEKELKEVSKKKEEAIRDQSFELAGNLRDQEQTIRDQIREMTLEWKEKKGQAQRFGSAMKTISLRLWLAGPKFLSPN